MKEAKENIALHAFRKYGDTVLRAAFQRVGSYSEAEDITQEVFLGLHASPREFVDDNHLKAWLLRVVINRSINHSKSCYASRRTSLDELNEAVLSYEFTERDCEIIDKVRQLPEKYSTVIYLYYYEEYNTREIAELLGKSENTVSSLLRRGREKLRLEIEKEEQL